MERYYLQKTQKKNQFLSKPIFINSQNFSKHFTKVFVPNYSNFDMGTKNFIKSCCSDAKSQLNSKN